LRTNSRAATIPANPAPTTTTSTFFVSALGVGEQPIAAEPAIPTVPTPRRFKASRRLTLAVRGSFFWLNCFLRDHSSSEVARVVGRGILSDERLTGQLLISRLTGNLGDRVPVAITLHIKGAYNQP
jgi:hypothetical protein